MTILANRKAAGDLTSKVLVSKQRHKTWDGGFRERLAGEIILVLAHQNIGKRTAAFWQNNEHEHVQFFQNGAMQTLKIGPDFDSNWGIIEPEDRLKGAHFVFTGALGNTREFYSQIVEMFGGTSQPSITKKTNYLVMADMDSMTTKAVKARENGVTLLDEKAFFDLIEKGL